MRIILKNPVNSILFRVIISHIVYTKYRIQTFQNFSY